LMDKGPQFVGAHVLKVRKLDRLISLRPTRKADHRSGQSIEAAGEGVSRL
jgi:hypothetical protein